MSSPLSTITAKDTSKALLVLSRAATPFPRMLRWGIAQRDVTTGPPRRGLRLNLFRVRPIAIYNRD